MRAVKPVSGRRPGYPRLEAAWRLLLGAGPLLSAGPAFCDATIPTPGQAGHNGHHAVPPPREGMNEEPDWARLGGDIASPDPPRPPPTAKKAPPCPLSLNDPPQAAPQRPLGLRGLSPKTAKSGTTERLVVVPPPGPPPNLPRPPGAPPPPRRAINPPPPPPAPAAKKPPREPPMLDGLLGSRTEPPRAPVRIRLADGSLLDRRGGGPIILHRHEPGEPCAPPGPPWVAIDGEEEA